MPASRDHIPRYRHYKPKNLAVVRIDGKDHYLGRFDSPESFEDLLPPVGGTQSAHPAPFTNLSSPASLNGPRPDTYKPDEWKITYGFRSGKWTLESIVTGQKRPAGVDGYAWQPWSKVREDVRNTGSLVELLK